MNPASIYVYYKVNPERLRDLQSVIPQLFAAIWRAEGVQGRWQNRRDDATTYMEVYPDVQDLPRFEATLARECERLQIDRYLLPSGARRIERFVAAG
ncbi:MAG: DUF4936 family protein [Burkholderiales bacterium]